MVTAAFFSVKPVLPVIPLCPVAASDGPDTCTVVSMIFKSSVHLIPFPLVDVMFNVPLPLMVSGVFLHTIPAV